MKLITLASGSTGNCYLLEHSGRYIILDCGIPFEKITHSRKFPSFKDIDLLIVTHSHLDHSKSLTKFEFSGVETLTYKTLSDKVENYTFGDWTITSFKVMHNTDNWGFIIKHKDSTKKFCYVTDTYGMPKIEGIDYWLLEVNYIEDIVDKMIENEQIEEMHNGFVYHNSLEKTIEYFSNIKTKPKVIICCHLSGMYGIEETIKEKLKPFATQIEIAKGGYIWKEEAE